MDDEALTRGTLGEEPPVPVDVPGREQRRFNVIVLLALSAAAILLLGHMLWPFASGLVSAVILAVLFFPVHARIRDWTGRPQITALASTTALFFVVFLPVLGVSVALFRSLGTHTEALVAELVSLLAQEGPVRRAIRAAPDWIGVDQATLTEGLEAQIRQLGSFLAGRTLGILSGLGGGLIQAAVALFTLFFLLRDGPLFLREMRRLVPLDRDLTDALLDRGGEVIHATMIGGVVVGIAQGTLGGLTFWLLGIPGAVLWGTVMGLLGLIPVVGPPVIWGPVAAYLLLQGDVARAVILTTVGMGLIATIDNILRAAVVGDRAHLHPLVVFCSALGGILLFGAVGIFFGPVLFVLSLSILEVTRAVLDPAEESG